MPVTSLQEQARALGDPTRHEIFRAVADADGPLDVADLTARFGLNHNAVRQHLGKLVAAGLVVESHAPPRGRGRPRLVYAVDPGADGRWSVEGPYERLSHWMSEVIRTGDAPVDVGRRIGRRRALPPGADRDPASTLTDQMARDGFDPVLRRRGRHVDIVLQTCPFASTALLDPDTVCALHLGIARGVAERTGDDLVVDELVRKDPRRAQCRLRGHLDG